MRVLLVVAHYFKPDSEGRHSSTSASMQARRYQAMTQSLLNWRALCDPPCLIDIETKSFIKDQSVNTGIQLDIALLVHEDNHLVDKTLVSAFKPRIVHVQTNAPKMLPFGAHQFIADHCNQYDWFIYSEDDLVLHDTSVFVKQAAFQNRFGVSQVLQPNRFELNPTGQSVKTYIDGNLRSGFIDPLLDQYAGSSPRSLELEYGSQRIEMRLARNPHSGFFMLSAEQVGTWIKKPHFLDMDCSFISPLESAASLSLLKSFAVYKSYGASMNFLEIEHLDNKFSRMKLPLRQQ
jgi:hypothetical protein